VQTHFTASACIECDACVDVCPVSCLTIVEDPALGDEVLRTRLSAPAVNLTQALFSSPALPQTKRLMVKDEDVCLHCGLCAERCPTAAWEMMEFDLMKPGAGGRETSGGWAAGGGVTAPISLATPIPVREEART
jgi:ferredoxin